MMTQLHAIEVKPKGTSNVRWYVFKVVHYFTQKVKTERKKRDNKVKNAQKIIHPSARLKCFT